MSDGIRIFPRIEEVLLPPVRAHRRERAPFGIAELDRLLHGGLTNGATVLAGAPGAGKTTLGLHWAVTAATPESASLMVSFAERPDQLRSKAAAFGLELDTKFASGALTVMRLPSFQIDPDRFAMQVLAALTPATTRLVIDDMAGLLFVLGPRAAHFLAALADHLYHRGIISLFLLEIEAFAGLRFDIASTPISLVADNVLIVQQAVTAGAIHRILAILKMRYSTYDPTIRELVLGENGVQVRTPAEIAPAVVATAVRDGGFTHDGSDGSTVTDSTQPGQ
jgi:circadian clock protein KaiC